MLSYDIKYLYRILKNKEKREKINMTKTLQKDYFYVIKQILLQITFQKITYMLLCKYLNFIRKGD